MEFDIPKAATETYNEISVRRGVPFWKMPICSRHRGLLENRMCSRTRKGFLENKYLFDEKIEALGKFVCVRGLYKGFWEN